MKFAIALALLALILGASSTSVPSDPLTAGEVFNHDRRIEEDNIVGKLTAKIQREEIEDYDNNSNRTRDVQSVAPGLYGDWHRQNCWHC